MQINATSGCVVGAKDPVQLKGTNTQPNDAVGYRDVEATIQEQRRMRVHDGRATRTRGQQRNRGIVTKDPVARVGRRRIVEVLDEGIAAKPGGVEDRSWFIDDGDVQRAGDDFHAALAPARFGSRFAASGGDGSAGLAAPRSCCRTGMPSSTPAYHGLAIVTVAVAAPTAIAPASRPRSNSARL